MADLGGEFDVNSVKPREFGLIPKGEYEAIIIASERKKTNAGDGEFLKLTLQIISGEFQNRRLWDNLNLWNKNEETVQIAKGTLSSIGRAVGVPTISDSSQLHDRPMRIIVSIKDDKQRINGYKPRNAGPATPSSPVAANAVPW